MYWHAGRADIRVVGVCPSGAAAMVAVLCLSLAARHRTALVTGLRMATLPVGVGLGLWAAQLINPPGCLLVSGAHTCSWQHTFPIWLSALIGAGGATAVLSDLDGRTADALFAASGLAAKRCCDAIGRLGSRYIHGPWPGRGRLSRATSSVRIRRMLHVPSSSGSRVLAISVVTAILALSGASCGSMTGTMTIVNVDGPGVAVVPWSGGPTISVDCGTTQS